MSGNKLVIHGVSSWVIIKPITRLIEVMIGAITRPVSGRLMVERRVRSPLL